MASDITIIILNDPSHDTFRSPFLLNNEISNIQWQNNKNSRVLVVYSPDGNKKKKKLQIKK